MSEIENLFPKIQAYTYCSIGKLNTLKKACEYINRNSISGDCVECGTYKGGSAAIISKYMDSNRHLWLYDSFAGLPETSPVDGEDAKQWIGGCYAHVEDVYEVMNLVGTSGDRYTIKKGWFKDTFVADGLPEKVALLHCDADWYDSVYLVLDTFYHRISEGGCIILDDFGFWEGCREAMYDFCFTYKVKPLIERVETDQAFWIKGRTNNRSPLREFM